MDIILDGPQSPQMHFLMHTSAPLLSQQLRHAPSWFAMVH